MPVWYHPSKYFVKYLKSASVKISRYTVLQRQLATNSRLFSISKSATYESTNPAYFLLTSAGYLLTKIAQNHGIYKPLLNYIRNTMRLGYEVWRPKCTIDVDNHFLVDHTFNIHTHTHTMNVCILCIITVNRERFTGTKLARFSQL